MNEPDLLRCWGSYIVFTAKTASNKFRALTCSIKLLSSEVGLYFYKCNLCGIYLCYMILHWILLSCLLWSLPFPFGYVEMGIKDCWSFICCSRRTFTHCWKVASVSLFYRNHLSICSFELAEWFHFFIPVSDWLVFFIGSLIFLSLFLDLIRISVSTVSLPGSGILCPQNTLLQPLI